MKLIFTFIVCILNVTFLLAQDTEKQAIDPSNPTNLYTQVNSNLEYQKGKIQDLYGLLMNIQYAFNPDNLMLLELPVLHNGHTGGTGVGDLRLRYFTVVKRNMKKRLFALAPFTDISVPIGSYKKGIGTSSWSIAVGMVAGYLVSSRFSLFPGVSVVHITKPGTELIPDESKFSSTGIGLQFNGSLKFSKQTYCFINPTPSFLSTNGNWKTYWSGEFSLNHIVKPNKLKMNIGWNPNFTADIHVFRLGATLYL